MWCAYCNWGRDVHSAGWGQFDLFTGISGKPMFCLLLSLFYDVLLCLHFKFQRFTYTASSFFEDSEKLLRDIVSRSIYPPDQ